MARASRVWSGRTLGSISIVLAVIVAACSGGGGEARPVEEEEAGAAQAVEDQAVVDVEDEAPGGGGSSYGGLRTSAPDEEADGSTIEGYSEPRGGEVAEADAVDETPSEDFDEVPRLPRFAAVNVSQSRLRPSDLAGHDEFGWSGAVDGDTAVVSAPLHDAQGIDSGAAYVFARSAEGWEETAKLVPADAEAGDWFARWVAIDGDTIVAGAPLATVLSSEDETGVAYVFVRTDEGWEQQARLTPSDPGGGDMFGWSVGVSGDTAVIAAWADNSGGENSGSIYIFERKGQTWIETQKLLADDPGVGDNFGIDVSISGETIVVGATGDDVGGRETGAAYVFEREGGKWRQAAKLLPDALREFGEMGHSVEVRGDVIVVGAPFDIDGGAQAGAAYVYERVDGAWTLQAKLAAAERAAGQWFGFGVSVDEDLVLVGAPHFRDLLNGVTRAGTAYLFERSGDGWRKVARVSAEDVVERGDGSDFGWVVSLSSGSAFVGAWLADVEVGEDAGAGYMFVVPEE